MGGLEEERGEIGKLRAALLGEPGQLGMQGELSAVSASLREFRSEWDRDPRIRETLIALEKDVKQVLPLSIQAEFQKAVEALRGEIRALQDQVDDLEGRNKDLLSENEDFRSQVALLESEVERTIALQDQRSEARARLENLTASIASESEQMEQMQAEVQDLRITQDDLRAAIGNIAQDLDGIISDYEAAVVGVPPQNRLIYVNRFKEVLAKLRELATDNLSRSERMKTYSSGATWQSDKRSRSTWPLAEVTGRTLINSLFRASVLLP